MIDAAGHKPLASRQAFDRIATARAKLDRINGGYQVAVAPERQRRAVFDGAKVPGTIAMLEGGARIPARNPDRDGEWLARGGEAVSCGSTGRG